MKTEREILSLGPCKVFIFTKNYTKKNKITKNKKFKCGRKKKVIGRYGLISNEK